MKKERLEAFSDGVIAIIITIMVLEMRAPSHTKFSALLPIIPVFLSYVLSYIYLAIYWVNHHRIFQATEKISGKTLWVNLYWLFWLSLIPFTTSWVGENHLESVPIALYGANLFLCAASFRLLEKTLLKVHNTKSVLVQNLQDGKKEKISMLIYFCGIILAFINIFLSIVCYVSVAIWWIIPTQKVNR